MPTEAPAKESAWVLSLKMEPGEIPMKISLTRVSCLAHHDPFNPVYQLMMGGPLLSLARTFDWQNS